MTDLPNGVTGGPPPAGEVTQFLIQWRGGNREALHKLLPLVYAELRRQAKSLMRRERRDHTLQPTALVHEAYLKLFDQRFASWQNRAHFFAVAARAMREILVDHARARAAAKRGGGATRVALEDAMSTVEQRSVDLIALDQALARLGALDPGQSQLVELRFFAGLTIEETAEVLGRSVATVNREWRHAQAWLHRELAGVAP